MCRDNIKDLNQRENVNVDNAKVDEEVKRLIN
jgi:hypothetical protein